MLETNDEWAAGRRYMSPKSLAEISSGEDDAPADGDARGRSRSLPPPAFGASEAALRGWGGGGIEAPRAGGPSAGVRRPPRGPLRGFMAVAGHRRVRQVCRLPRRFTFEAWPRDPAASLFFPGIRRFRSIFSTSIRIRTVMSIRAEVEKHQPARSQGTLLIYGN